MYNKVPLDYMYIICVYDVMSQTQACVLRGMDG